MPSENQPVAEWKEYPEPEFPNDKAHVACRMAKEKIRKAFFSASPDTFLNLTGYGLTALPPEVGQLKGLTKLHLYSHQLMELPPEIGQLTALKGLSLYSNNLMALPPEIGGLTFLTELDLAGNSMLALPPRVRCAKDAGNPGIPLKARTLPAAVWSEAAAGVEAAELGLGKCDGGAEGKAQRH
jgi:hypothetical protein